jgi:hypothetical protein
MAVQSNGGSVRPDVWRDTTVKVEPRFNGLYRNALTTERLKIRDGRLLVGGALATFPVAMLSRDLFSETQVAGQSR